MIHEERCAARKRAAAGWPVLPQFGRIPAGALAGQAHHQILKLRVDAGSSHGPALFRPIELVSDEPAVPSEQGIWFRDICHFLQGFALQTFADLGQRDPLAISQTISRLNVASKISALSARRMPHDWHARYCHHPLLIETLVEVRRFRGTCYRAANWIYVGQTTGRGRMDREHKADGQAIKDIYVYPLVRDARDCLCGDPAHQGSRR